MCTIPKPPPPPPPLELSYKQDTSNAPVEDFSNSSYQPILNNPSDCIWADKDPELRRACVVSRICLDKPPHQLIYKKYKSLLQVGPTCGLAALSMLIDEKVDLDTILVLARLEGFTNQGEMLSCEDMGKLVGKVFSSADIGNIKHQVKNGDLWSHETIQTLLNGGALLVPYDADVNHAPSLKNGHTAHWCLVCGVILISKPESTTNTIPENVYVLCWHGKSKFLSAWKLEDLAKSNSNLWEFSPKKQSDGLEYVQPEGGLGGKNGLRRQYLMFHWV